MKRGIERRIGGGEEGRRGEMRRRVEKVVIKFHIDFS